MSNLTFGFDKITGPSKLHRARSKPKGLYAALPGTGPAGETCGSCKHIFRVPRYRKCGLCRPLWTGGPGTDIKARSPACSKWEAADEA